MSPFTDTTYTVRIGDHVIGRSQTKKGIVELARKLALERQTKVKIYTPKDVPLAEIEYYALRKRLIEDFFITDRISISDDTCSGHPRIAGTRLRVADILHYLANGMSVDEIVARWSYITKEDVIACLRYAAEAMNGEKPLSLPEWANADAADDV
jgi:uncharacterized protein (DUF433 family)